MMNFHPLKSNGQPHDYLSKILTNFIIKNSNLQIVTRNTKLWLINTYHKEKDSDVKKLHRLINTSHKEKDSDIKKLHRC